MTERPLAQRVLEIGGRRLPFLRWSVLRMALGGRTLLKTWQVGDGREEALAQYVFANARAGDVDDAIRTVDEFCYTRKVMMNVGDEKGAILDAAIRRTSPRRLLELGAYCGYSGLRTARVMPADAHLYSVEFSADNAAIARRVWDHAGVGDRVTVVVGSLGDGGKTIAALDNEHGFSAGTLDFVFIDHDKAAYLPDLRRILDAGWLHPGSVVVADNVRLPGAPKYRAFMRDHEGTQWRTVEHETHLEYQSLVKDLVLESELVTPDGRSERTDPTGIELRDEPFDGDAGRALVAAFIEEIAELYPGWGPRTGPSAEPGDFVPPRGRFVVAYFDGGAAGCGGVKRLDDTTAEIKRMYVAPEARGSGVAQQLLARLESIATEMGCTIVRLDTGDKQPAALALYCGAGYHNIDDYNANPYARHWLEKMV